MNYGTIYRRIISEGGFDSSAGNVPTSQVQQWVAEAYSELVLESEFLSETVAIGTLVAGQSVYAFDNLALDRLRTLVVGTARYTRVGAEQMFDLKAGRLGLGAESDGAFAPSYGATGTISIELFPGPTVAGATLTGIFNAEPPTLTLDADVPVIPAAYHLGIVYGAVATGKALIDEDLEASQAFGAKFEAVKQKLRAHKNKRVGSGVVQVQIAGVHF